MRYVINSKVVSVVERTAVKSATVVDRGLPSEHIDTKLESKGWFLTVIEGVSFGLGKERPMFESGDRIKIMLEKVEGEG